MCLLFVFILLNYNRFILKVWEKLEKSILKQAWNRFEFPSPPHLLLPSFFPTLSFSSPPPRLLVECKLQIWALLKPKCKKKKKSVKEAEEKELLLRPRVCGKVHHGLFQFSVDYFSFLVWIRTSSATDSESLLFPDLSWSQICRFIWFSFFQSSRVCSKVSGSVSENSHLFLASAETWTSWRNGAALNQFQEKLKTKLRKRCLWFYKV